MSWTSKNPLVSVVIPAFRAERFIERAINSVREQSYPNWEIVVVEDGSKDTTESLVARFSGAVSQNVIYSSNKTNIGVSATRNRAMSLARGEVIAFLDSDDWWSCEHLKAGLSSLLDGAGICFSGFHIYDERKGERIETEPPTAEQLADPITSLLQRNYIQASSLVMLWTKVANATDQFDTELRVGEDVDYWVRLMLKGHSMQWTGQTTCYYAKHEESAMAKTLIVAEETVKLHRKHLHSGFLPWSVRKRLLARSLLQHARLIWRSDRMRARPLFVEAFMLQPMNPRMLAYVAAVNAACMLLRRRNSPE